ncbi:MAG: hybrid sensor histidine kinase/response regulator, partial [Eubacterium coprostanoligenes]|nr:hybrid sensor histidine kinase/response regulator [Eubacterium coprostanoligenes]
VTVKKLKSKKRTVIAYWGKISDARGYQIQLSTNKKFKKNKKTFSIENQKASKKTIKNLKAKKKYYVRVRAYRYSYFGDGEKIYGKWSKVKSVKTK